MGFIRNLSGNVDVKSLYCDTPGESAFLSEALDAEDYGAVLFTIQAGANDESITAKVTECATSGGTYADISGATFALDHTATGSVVYTCFCKRDLRYMKVSVTSTPTAAIEYAIASIGHAIADMPVS